MIEIVIDLVIVNELMIIICLLASIRNRG